MVLAMKNHPMAGKSSPARIARMARAACCFVFMEGHSEETFSNYKGSGHPSLGLGRPSSGEYEATLLPVLERYPFASVVSALLHVPRY